MLYLILHGIVAGKKNQGFVTHDVDFFLGRNYLVTVQHEPSRSIEAERAICSRHSDVLAEGPVSLLHRIVDRDRRQLRPEVDALEDRLDGIEQTVFSEAEAQPAARHPVAQGRHRLAAPRRRCRSAMPSAGSRAASSRRFPRRWRTASATSTITWCGSTDEAMFLQDRVTGLLDAHLATQSNRLNQVMKVLTVISTIFMPLTVLTGVFGMNVHLPSFPADRPRSSGGSSASWRVISAGMLWMFRRLDWL